MTVSFNVRQAGGTDAEKIAPLFDQYRMFYAQKSSASEALAFITERLKNADSALYVVEDGTIVVGFAQLYPAFSSVAMKRIWILNDLFVRSESRGKGAGRILLGASKKHAQETGARGLTLKTATDNLAAQKLYAACGWTRETTFVSYNLKAN